MLSMFRTAAAAGLLLVSFTLETRAQEPAAEVEHFLGLPLIANSGPTDPTLPPGYFVEEVASGFFFPTAMAFAPDGRIFVAEKRGRVWVIEDGERLPQPFINLGPEVLNHWDRGLLGIAVHPDFEETPHFYLLYTVDHDGSGPGQRHDVFSRLTRYTASADDPNVADPDSRHVLIGETFSEGWPACYYSHVIGTVIFGTDGTLLVGSGEAASFAEVDAGGLYPDCFGPDRIDPIEDVGAFRSIYPGSLAGKILRVDPETGLGLPSNPFYSGDANTAEARTWATGLRNPFRFSRGADGSTDPVAGDPGTLYIGDVGDARWEEINIAVGGENFGWPCYEGPGPHAGYQAAEPAHSSCDTVGDGEATPPTFYWHHWLDGDSHPAGLTAKSIIVGDVYAGHQYPEETHDALWFADYVRGWMAYAPIENDGDLSTDLTVFSLDTGFVVDLRFDPVTEDLHYIEIHSGRVMRIGFDPELGGEESAEVGRSLRIESVHPNPARGMAALEASVVDPGVHIVEAFDLLGRPVWRSEAHWNTAGSSRITLDFPGLPSGAYVVRVTSPGGESATSRLTILR